MKTRLTIDGAGRVALPEPLRKKLFLAAGDMLEVESTGEKITLRPVRKPIPLTKEKGVWVSRTGHPLPASTAEALLKDIRQKRDRRNTGCED